MQNGKAYEWLHHLTKKIGNRLTGSDAYNKAVEWGKLIMQEAGAENVFLQECTAVNWKRGKNDIVAITSLNNKKQTTKLNAFALGNSMGGDVTAPIIAFNNYEEFENKKDEVKDKIVFFNYPFNQTNIETFLSYGENGKYRYNGASRVAKYGGLGCVIRSLSGSTDNFPHTGVMRYNDSFPKIPAAALGLKDADKLWELCKTNNVSLNINTHGSFNNETIVHNVVGEIIGKEFPNEFITIGGHLDSWDVGEGAHDDGAGCVQTMEILRIFRAMNYQPKHSIRFVLFANEENGTSGGKQYAQEAETKKENHVFALESDAGGFTPRGFGFKMSDEKIKKIQNWLPLLQPYGTTFLRKGGGGADINPLNEKFKTPLSGLSPDSQRYFDLHHTDNDIFENVNRRELLLGAINMAALIYLVDKYGL